MAGKPGQIEGLPAVTVMVGGAPVTVSVVAKVNALEVVLPVTKM